MKKVKNMLYNLEEGLKFLQYTNNEKNRIKKFVETYKKDEKSERVDVLIDIESKELVLVSLNGGSRVLSHSLSIFLD